MGATWAVATKANRHPAAASRSFFTVRWVMEMLGSDARVTGAAPGVSLQRAGVGEPDTVVIDLGRDAGTGHVGRAGEAGQYRVVRLLAERFTGGLGKLADTGAPYVQHVPLVRSPFLSLNAARNIGKHPGGSDRSSFEARVRQLASWRAGAGTATA
ncbi:hypothetical protein [Actinoplanes nipponensis]|nr:hypothetical protein [Actinoplanes nipponensis]